jgi:beta-galactosidase
VYKLTFDLPWQNGQQESQLDAAATTDYTLLFHGVESACQVVLNGHVLGFSKDSRLPFEFDVTPYLRRTQNRLYVVVIRWSDGSYVEDQDHWWMAGIHRSVELIRRVDGADILDYQVQADASGHLAINVDCRQRQPHQPPLRVVVLRLYDDEQLTADGDMKTGRCTYESAPLPVDEVHSRVQTAATFANVKLWSAEVPHLYTLTIAFHVDGAVKQVESCRVGFRTVDIHNGRVHVNGKPITVCGMNRHEHDPDHGKVVSLERMKQDIVTLKYVPSK